MRIFVAGATGAVGSEVVRLAKERGHYLHTLSRSPAKALKLAGIADRIDVLDASVEVPNLLGIDIVVSCLGAPVSLFSPDRRGYRAVDLQANSNLLRAAKTAGIQRFLYVAAHVGPAYSRTAYIRAHEDFVNVLHSSGLSSSVVRPTGIFAAFDDLLTLARRGLTTVIGDGRARTNPIHQADVAAQVLALLDFGPGEISIGGPEIWSRREIAELPFRALGRPPRILSIPAFAFRAGGKMMGGVNPRLGQLCQFFAAVSTTDCVAPVAGHLRLQDHFRSLAADSQR